METRKPTHPGEVLYEDILKPLNISITEAASNLEISRKTLSEIIHGKCSITPEMAVRIAYATSTTPESWLNMQTKLDLWKIKESKTIHVSKFSEVISA
jgi:addiction module HigA family antidote